MEDLLKTRFEQLQKSKGVRNQKRLQPDIYHGATRRRIILAPLMSEAKEKCDFDLVIEYATKENSSQIDKDLKIDQNVTSWINERKLLNSSLAGLQLSSSWLTSKQMRTDLEDNVLNNMKLIEASRLRGNIQDEIDAIHSKNKNKSDHGSDQTDFCQPLPEGLGVIAKYLHDNHLRLVDLFAQLDKNKDWFLTRDEFCSKMSAKGVPLSSNQLEEVLMCLDNDKNDMLDYQELAQGIEAFRQDDRLLKSLNCKSSSMILDDAHTLAEKQSISCSRLSQSTNPSSSHSVSTSPNVRSSSLKLKSSKEKTFEQEKKRKRHKKKETKPLHSSTLSGNIGLLKDEFIKRNQSQTNHTIKVITEKGIPISETTFKHVLLHPLDQKEKGDNCLKIRQPGIFCHAKDTFLTEKDKKKIADKYFGEDETEIQNVKTVKRNLRNKKQESSKSVAPSPFWPQSLLDKIRLCMDNDTPVRGSRCHFQLVK